MSLYNEEGVDRYVFIPSEDGEYKDSNDIRGNVLHVEPGVNLATLHEIHHEMIWEEVDVQD